MCNKWWRVCFTYGDQYKQYRHLYSKKTRLPTLRKEEEKGSGKAKDDKKKEEKKEKDGVVYSCQDVPPPAGIKTTLVLDRQCCHLWEKG